MISLGKSNASPRSTLLPAKYTLLPADWINPNIAINGRSYSLDLLAKDRNFERDHKAAAKELQSMLPLPKPIIVVGMPKAGTTTIYHFFEASGSKAVHWKFESPQNNSTEVRIGTCMKEAFQQGKPLLKTCGDFEVWAQIDVSNPGTDWGCYYPQILNLMEIHQEAPNATFILNRRNFTDWASSFHRWGANVGDRDRLDNRLAQCTPFGPKSSSQEDLISWHQEQIQRVRQFVVDHPSHALMEVDIQDPTAGKRMSQAFQINDTFWGQSNTNRRETAPPRR